MTTLRDQLSRAWVFLVIPLLALTPIVWGQNPKWRRVRIKDAVNLQSPGDTLVKLEYHRKRLITST